MAKRRGRFATAEPRAFAMSPLRVASRDSLVSLGILRCMDSDTAQVCGFTAGASLSSQMLKKYSLLLSAASVCSTRCRWDARWNGATNARSALHMLVAFDASSLAPLIRRFDNQTIGTGLSVSQTFRNNHRPACSIEIVARHRLAWIAFAWISPAQARHRWPGFGIGDGECCKQRFQELRCLRTARRKEELVSVNIGW